MQTLKDRLDYYCKQNNKTIPMQTSQAKIGSAIVAALKQQEKYDLVAKVEITETYYVNDFPDELIEIVDGIINKFFTDQKAFYEVLDRKQPKPFSNVPKFMFVLEDYKCSAFEKALKYLEIPVQVNDGFNNKDGKVQYVIPAENPIKLIKLGKRFQKERGWEKSERYKQMQKGDNKQVSAPEPQKEIKRGRPRKPVSKKATDGTE